MQKKFMAALLIGLFLIAGCASKPQDVVEKYFQALADEDLKEAKSFISPALAVDLEKDPDSDFNDTGKYKEVTVSQKVARFKYSDGSYDQVRIPVQYIGPDGENTVYAFVAKKEKDSPWKIVRFSTNRLGKDSRGSKPPSGDK